MALNNLPSAEPYIYQEILFYEKEELYILELAGSSG